MGLNSNIENRCSVSGPNSSLWYRVAYWTPIQVEQEHATLVCPTDWAILTYVTDVSGCILATTPALGELRWMGFLSQGSVLSPTLFNLYTNDLPVTGSRKFIYADDICLTKQAQRYAELECYVSSDMVPMAAYCHLFSPTTRCFS